MKNWIIGIVILGFASPAFSQLAYNEIKGSSASKSEAAAVNLAYFHRVKDGTYASVVQGLQRRVADYDVTSTPEFMEDPDNCEVTFAHPQGYIHVSYDNDGRIRKSEERYKDVLTTKAVRNAIARDYPGWTMTQNAYKISYERGTPASKAYTIKLEKGNNSVTLTMDTEGNEL